jgi:hypothetical protein
MTHLKGCKGGFKVSLLGKRISRYLKDPGYQLGPMTVHLVIQLTLSMSSAASLTRIDVILLSRAAAMGGPCEARISSYRIANS